MKRLLLILSFIIGLSVYSFGQASFSVNAPGRVPVGSKFPVTYILKNAEASTSSLKVPQINGCTLIYGPSIATSQSYQVVNGQATSSSQHEYTYYYRADKEGTFNIGEASIVANGKKLTTRPTKVTVVASNNSQQPQSGASGKNSQPVAIDDISTQQAGRNVNGNDVFIRISTSRSTAYEQEAIECTIKLYTKYSISELMPITQPTFNGFLVEDLQFQSSINARETVNGQEYLTAVLKKCVLFPQKSGKLTIVSGTYDLSVVQYDQVNMGFYTVNQPTTKKIRINSNSASVNVLPLPSPQPTGFTGAVGHFDVNARMSTSNFRTNEPATLTYIVNGEGNIKYLKDPDVDFPTEFEQYTPQHTVDAEMKGNNVSGTSTTVYTFIPKEVGNYTVTVPDFVYFDTTTKEYRTIKIDPFAVKVGQGVSSPVTNQQYVTSKNTDILFIKTGDKNLTKSRQYIISETWYWFVYLGLALAFVVVFMLNLAAAKRAANISGMKYSKANKVARKRLKAAAKFKSENDPEHFYAEMLKAMWGYLSDKLAIPASQLLRPTIAQELSAHGAPESVCASVIELLDICEMARYTPTSDQPEQMDSVYAKATETINELEKIKLSKNNA